MAGALPARRTGRVGRPLARSPEPAPSHAEKRGTADRAGAQAALVMGTEEVAHLAGGAGSEHGLAGSIDNRGGTQAGQADPAAEARAARGRASTELTTVQGPNQVWTIDYQGKFRTGDGQWLYPLTVVDSCSRYLLLCDGHGQANGQNVRASMQNLFREHGLPERLRSDNGTPFASTRAGRLNRLSVWWIKLGIAVERIAPGRPQQRIGNSSSNVSSGFRSSTTRTGRPRHWGNCRRKRCTHQHGGHTRRSCASWTTPPTGSAAECTRTGS